MTLKQYQLHLITEMSGMIEAARSPEIMDDVVKLGLARETTGGVVMLETLIKCISWQLRQPEDNVDFDGFLRPEN